jgi:hypothetical protein
MHNDAAATLGRIPLPSVAPEARAMIAATIAQAANVAGRPVECTFVGSWSRERRQVTDVRLMAWGAPTESLVFPHDCRPGEMLIHSHCGHPLVPSPEDLKSAFQVDTLGIGSAIVSEDGSGLFVLREPRSAPPMAPRARSFKVLSWYISIMRLERPSSRHT